MAKKPSKEDFQLKERIKIESDVFDKRTLLNLSKLFKKVFSLTLPLIINSELIKSLLRK